MEVPVYAGLAPFIYVMNGDISVSDVTTGKQEAVTDLDNPLLGITANEDTTVVLFVVDLSAGM